MLQRHPILRRTFLTLVVLYVAQAALGGMVLDWIALHPPRRRLTTDEESSARATAAAASDSFADASIVTPDGVKLSAWFLRPQSGNGDAVILLHGVSNNRMEMYGYAKWLLHQHYAVLLPDARGHGLSTGLATYGVKESDDVHQWVDWLENAYHPHCVYGLGESMGAAELLQALPKEHHFCAVVAESSYASLREAAYARFGSGFHAGPWIGSTLFRPTLDAGFFLVKLVYGFDMDTASPKQAVEKATTPILLIQGLSDRKIPPFHADEIQAHNPGDIIVWKVPGAAHTGAHKAAPEEFERRVLSWFTSHSSAN